MLEMESAERKYVLYHIPAWALFSGPLGTYRSCRPHSVTFSNSVCMPLSTDVSAQFDSGEGCSWLAAGAL